MRISDIIIAVKGAGEMATGVAASLYRAGLRHIVMFDMAQPLAVRVSVSFCQALIAGQHTVEGIGAQHVRTKEDLTAAWASGTIAVCDAADSHLLDMLAPHVLIDATVAKKNSGMTTHDAPLVIALGPGFLAGTDAHVVIETQRGHNLGRLIYSGTAAPNTGTPEAVMGYTHDRVLRAPCAGTVTPVKQIGDSVQKGDVIMHVNGIPVHAAISGMLRGCITKGVTVHTHCKIGDIDPRDEREYCFCISDKARSLGGSALTAVVSWMAEQETTKMTAIPQAHHLPHQDVIA